jgi:hypothetical protein
MRTLTFGQTRNCPPWLVASAQKRAAAGTPGNQNAAAPIHVRKQQDAKDERRRIFGEPVPSAAAFRSRNGVDAPEDIGEVPEYTPDEPYGSSTHYMPNSASPLPSWMNWPGKTRGGGPAASGDSGVSAARTEAGTEDAGNGPEHDRLIGRAAAYRIDGKSVDGGMAGVFKALKPNRVAHPSSIGASARPRVDPYMARLEASFRRGVEEGLDEIAAIRRGASPASIAKSLDRALELSVAGVLDEGIWREYVRHRDLFARATPSAKANMKRDGDYQSLCFRIANAKIDRKDKSAMLTALEAA